MNLDMPITIKEPESTPTSNESRRDDDIERLFPPEHLLLNVVLTFSGTIPRLTAREIGVVGESDKVSEAFRQLIEGTREYLASSEDARSELLRYPPTMWFRFVPPNQVRYPQRPADLWPEGEDVEDFIAAATEGRCEEEEDEPES